MKRKPSGRHRRSRGTIGAMLRAALLFGPLGAILALATLAGSGETPVRAFALGPLDDVVTGSIAAPGVRPERRNGGPCLRFPDGSQRGDC